MKFRYPKRWSRAKRKARRVVDIRAWRYAEFMRVYKGALDKIWGDVFAPPEGFWGLGMGELLSGARYVPGEHETAQAGRFIDDGEFLP